MARRVNIEVNLLAVLEPAGDLLDDLGQSRVR
jgi:hypothetical protein